MIDVEIVSTQLRKVIMIKKYISKCNIITILITNFIVTIINTTLLFLGLIGVFGLFYPPDIGEQIKGIIILICVPIVFLVFNWINYRINCKFNKSTELLSNKQIVIKLIISLAGISLSISLMVLVPSIWLLFNDWWF